MKIVAEWRSRRPSCAWLLFLAQLQAVARKLSLAVMNAVPVPNVRFSIATCPVKQRSPFKNSSAHYDGHRRRLTISVFAILSPFPKLLSELLKNLRLERPEPQILCVKTRRALADGSRCANRSDSRMATDCCSRRQPGARPRIHGRNRTSFHVHDLNAELSRGPAA